jgi:opacity protein-like surface antigen
MRRLILAFALAGLATDAFAADQPEIPTLRGSDAVVPVLQPAAAVPIAAPAFARWGGFYAGGQLGYSSVHMDFSQATKSLVAFSLRELALEAERHPSEWEVLGQTGTQGRSFGGFAGYNSQWDEVIVGMELNYSRASFSVSAPNSPLGRVTAAGGNVYLVAITGSGSMQITDLATIRARAGWVVGNFLPYVTAGVAVGQAAFARSATVSGIENPTRPPVPCDGSASPPCTIFSFTQSEAKTNAFIYGFAVSAGVDFMLMSNVFVRGEVEYIGLAPISRISGGISTGRVGVGFKF